MEDKKNNEKEDSKEKGEVLEIKQSYREQWVLLSKILFWKKRFGEHRKF